MGVFHIWRKTEYKGTLYTNAVVPPPSHSTTTLTLQEARNIHQPFSKQLLDVLQTVIIRDITVLDTVRSITDSNPTQRKLFIGGIGWETTTDTLRSVFSTYGELDEVKLVTDKTTGKSKGYGFVTFKHIDSAILALKEPRKKIDGRTTVVEFATPTHSGSVDVSTRKVYVGNVPFEISSERLLSHFSKYGEIEEGPLGFDKQKGFAFFVYKTEEGARNAVAESVKNIDGHQVVCKMANVGKKGKAGGLHLPSYSVYSGGQNSQMNSSMPSAGVGGGSGGRDVISERLGLGVGYFSLLLVAAGAAMAVSYGYRK